MTRTTLTLLISAVVLASAFTGSAAAASNASIDASPAAPGETATHTTTITVGNTSTGSLNGYRVNYQDTGADVSNVGVEDVVAVGIDRDDDADGTTTDVNVSDDLSGVSSSNNGGTLSVSFGGSYSLNEGDEIVVVYENVTNPGEAGTYDVGIDINFQSSGGEATASLEVGTTSNAQASVTFTDQETSGETVTVDSTTLPDGGYIAIHASDDGSPGAVVGHSSYLDAGTSEDVEITLEEPVSEDQELIAMAHKETNGNEQYEFPGNDGPYTAEGSAVVDGAQITVTADSTSTSTMEPTETTEQSTESTEESTTSTSGDGDSGDDGESSQSSPGFGVGLTVVALLGAALVALRRAA
jgi:PGF-CTERM protein